MHHECCFVRFFNNWKLVVNIVDGRKNNNVTCFVFQPVSTLICKWNEEDLIAFAYQQMFLLPLVSRMAVSHRNTYVKEMSCSVSAELVRDAPAAGHRKLVSALSILCASCSGGSQDSFGFMHMLINIPFTSYTFTQT